MIRRLLLIGAGVLCVMGSCAVPQSVGAQSSAPSLPNDPLFLRQTYLTQVHTTAAWRYTTGSSQVTVAVIDSGVDINHPDLKDNIWTNPAEVPGDGIDNDENGYVDDVNGWDFINDIPDPRPKFTEGFSSVAINHGTLIAGIIAARGNNGFGVTGVSWRAKIMPLRVLNNQGEGDAETVARAIDYAIEKKANIINLSFVGNEDHQGLRNAINRAIKAGILVVAAGGNDARRQGVDLDESPHYPVCYDAHNTGLIGVGSTDPLGQKSNFSHYGRCIDISAPGGDFFSTQTVNYEFFGFDQYYGAGWSGTSLSTGVVSGAAALLLSLNPRLTPQQLVTYLTSTCDDIDALNPKYIGMLGCGQLNIGRAVTSLARAMNASVQIPALGGQTEDIMAITDSAGQDAIRFTDKDGKVVKEWYPFAPFKVPFTLAHASRGSWFVVGAGRGGGPQVRVFDAGLRLQSQFFAYDEAFRGGISVAIGDVDGDGKEEIVTAPLQGGGPHIKIFSLNGTLKGQFPAYHLDYRAGISLALGDIDDDGLEDIIMTSTSAYAPEVRIFSHRGVLKSQFLAYPGTQLTGVNLSVVDLNGDGIVEIITVPRAGADAQVKIFRPDGALIRSFYAYQSGFRGGASVIPIDLNHDGRYELVAAPLGGGGPQIRVFTPEGKVLSQFFAADPRDRRGLLLYSLKNLAL